MKPSTLALALVALLALGLPAQAQQYIELPTGVSILDITSDGSVVCGRGTGGAFYWRWRVDPAPVYVGGVDAVGISDDGSVLVGCIIDPGTNAEVAGRWTQATGWQNLGYLPNAQSCPSRSNAYDVSGDGSTVVGLSWDGCSGRGFVWTQATGMLELQSLANGSNRASAISNDGSLIGGFAQGNFSRTPALWDPANQNGYVYDPNFQGEVYNFNSDGSVVVGTNYFSGTHYSAFVGDPLGNFTDLGALHASGWAAAASDISEAGDVVVGFDYTGLAREAWVWKAGQGIVSLEDRLNALGFFPTQVLQVCRAVSDDGKVVVGFGGGTSGFGGNGFIAELEPQSSAWEDLGGGTGSIAGTPLLSGAGTLVAGTPTSLDLVGAPPSALSLVWVSLTSVPFPVFGGTLYANPFVSEFLIPLNGSGEFHAAFPWFAGVPSGLALHFQFIVQDPSIFWGFTLSNGLRATAP